MALDDRAYGLAGRLARGVARPGTTTIRTTFVFRTATTTMDRTATTTTVFVCCCPAERLRAAEANSRSVRGIGLRTERNTQAQPGCPVFQRHEALEPKTQRPVRAGSFCVKCVIANVRAGHFSAGHFFVTLKNTEKTRQSHPRSCFNAGMQNNRHPTS